MLVVIRGAGDIASGIALRLFRAGMQVVMCDLAVPTSIRRTVCFSEAIRLGETRVEDVRGVLCADVPSAHAAAEAGDVAVLVDPEAACVRELAPDALVDAILAKRNLGTTRDMAPVVIGVGPAFTAREDSDAAVERYLDRIQLKKFTNATITDRQALLELIRQARRDNYSGNIGENEEHIYSLCAPVYGLSGTMVAGVSLCGLQDVVCSDQYDSYLQSIRQVADDISRELGYSPK